MKYGALCAFALFVAACAGEPQVDVPADTTAPQQNIYDQIDVFAGNDYTLLDSQIVPYLRELERQFIQVPMYFKDADDYYFAVSDGDFPDFWNRKPDTVYHYTLGLANSQLELILPLGYDKFYSPDATAVGYMEVEKLKQKGLFNYKTKQLFPAKYDVIFPATDPAVVAYGKTGNRYYALLPDGSEVLVEDPDKQPTYLGLAQLLTYDIENTQWKYWIDCHTQLEYDKDKVWLEYGRYIVIPPSYLTATGFAAEYISGIETDHKVRASFAMSSSRNTIEASGKTNSGLGYLVSAFYQEGIDARGFVTQEKHLAVVKGANVLSKGKLYRENYAFVDVCPRPKELYRFINDTLIEVFDYYYTYPYSEKEYTAYDGMTHHKYFSIDAGGNLKPLDSKRFFDCTKYVVLTEDYFKGCFVKARYDREDELKWPKGDEENAWVTDHLSAEDLDIMLNEIYADYGKKFTSAKWVEYFGSKPWYTPKYNDVEHLLTEIDRQNIKLIYAIRAKVLANPDRYLNGRFTYYFPGS